MIFERIKSLLLQLGYIAKRLADPRGDKMCENNFVLYTLMNLDSRRVKDAASKSYVYVKDGIFINQEIAHQNMCVVLV